MIKEKEFDMETDPDYEALKAKDLRIGNYYGYAHEESLSYHQADIDFIKTQQEYNEDPDDDQFSRGWWAFPIPLTQEWMVKFGFEYDRVTWFKINVMLVKRSSEGYSVFYGTGHLSEVTLNYVHQLQNLYFALTGEELTLK
jgi:hypothetical protein